MNDMLKNKMDKFFEDITTEELIKKFEKLGYVFTDEKKGRTTNCTACSMLEHGVKFRKSPKHTCGK